MKTIIPRELLNSSKYADQRVVFEKRCQFYVDEVKNATQVTRFINNCKYSLIGTNSKRKWDAEEREWRLEILAKYFPERIDYILEYEREQLRIQEKKKQIKEYEEILKKI